MIFQELQFLNRRYVMNRKDLLAKRAVDPLSGCWNWLGTRTVRGYGHFYLGRSLGGPQSIRVHRLAASLWLGFDLKSGLYVCHHCDNPPCFNPAHLFVGTQSDNALDRSRKGRGRENRQLGEANPNSKLSDRAVQDIRKAAQRGESQVSIAQQYDVTQGHISRLVRREQRARHA